MQSEKTKPVLVMDKATRRLRAPSDPPLMKSQDFEQRDYNTQDADLEDYRRQEYNQQAYIQEADYNQPQLSRRDFHKQVIGRQKVSRQDFERQPYGLQAYGRQEYDRNEYNRQEYDRQDYERQAHGMEGYDRQAYTPQEYSRQEYSRFDQPETSGHTYDRQDYYKQKIGRQVMPDGDYAPRLQRQMTAPPLGASGSQTRMRAISGPSMVGPQSFQEHPQRRIQSTQLSAVEAFMQNSMLPLSPSMETPPRLARQMTASSSPPISSQPPLMRTTSPSSPTLAVESGLTRTMTARTSARPLASFFTLAKQALLGARVNKVPSTLVLGKDDPDLDSIASAVIFAYFRSALPPKDCWSPIYVPLLNERRAVLKKNAMLRRVLYHSKVSIDGLVTVDDVVAEGTQSGLLEDMTKFFFVDHNVRSPSFSECTFHAHTSPYR
jgi:hypothetical protein